MKYFEIIQKVLKDLGIEYSITDGGKTISMVVPNVCHEDENPYIVDSEAEITVQDGNCMISGVNKGCRFTYNHEDSAIECTALDIVNKKNYLLVFDQKYFPEDSEDFEHGLYLKVQGSIDLSNNMDEYELEKLRKFIREAYKEIEAMELNFSLCFGEALVQLGYRDSL